jgi:hypothetical protein
MSQSVEAPAQAASTSDLRAALEQALTCHFGKHRSIARLERRPADMRSSCALEEVNVCLDDGASLTLLFKDLSRHALVDAARQVKPAFLHDPLREIEIYRRYLAPGRMGTAACYGAHIDPRVGRYWLFLEKVPGVELFQVGDFATWQRVAHFLASMHMRFAAGADLLAPAQPAHLLAYNAEFFGVWLDRARDFLSTAPQPRQREAALFLERLAQRYEMVIARLIALPVTLIHGEFYASNVLIQENAECMRVCPVDWEMAGLGPCLLDLAALTAGAWTDEQKTTLALAYHAALPPEDNRRPSLDVFLVDLDYCRLHQAVQWLGWSPDWLPPPEQRRNWLSEAVDLAEKLGF